MIVSMIMGSASQTESLDTVECVKNCAGRPTDWKNAR
jgi:hypothetical protein